MLEKILAFLLGKKPSIRIHSPFNGKAVPLSEVPDLTFAEEMIGPGFAVIPEEEVVCSPVKGKVESIFPTKHAVSIVADGGAELLVHIGIDTVQRKGEGFETLVEQGATLDVGTPMVKFNKAELEAAGYNMITPVILTNSENFTFSKVTSQKNAQKGDEIWILNPKG